MTKEELDARLGKVRFPAPLIEVGPYHPIATYEGYGDPWPGWYRGVRVMTLEGLAGRARVMELDLDTTNTWLEV